MYIRNAPDYRIVEVTIIEGKTKATKKAIDDFLYECKLFKKREFSDQQMLWQNKNKCLY